MINKYLFTLNWVGSLSGDISLIYNLIPIHF